MAQIDHSKPFVVCLRNKGFQASLEVRKIYEKKPDAHAAKHNLVRVVDESGEDYLYPADFFISIELPSDVEEAIALAM